MIPDVHVGRIGVARIIRKTGRLEAVENLQQLRLLRPMTLYRRWHFESEADLSLDKKGILRLGHLVCYRNIGVTL